MSILGTALIAVGCTIIVFAVVHSLASLQKAITGLWIDAGVGAIGLVFVFIGDQINKREYDNKRRENRLRWKGDYYY